MRTSQVCSLFGLLILGATSASAQSALRAAPSTRATSEVTLTPAEANITSTAAPLTIKLDYGQPHLRGRKVHTDSLVPYDTPWRTGANAATRLITGVDLVIGGASIPKGTYVLFTLPTRAGWKLIVQKNSPTPEATYDAANDIVKVDLRLKALTEPVESLSMALIPVNAAGPARGELRISWATFALSADWSVK